ncbi:GNAT family N-acetyltransferase [Pararhizobium antarcticum]|uniref:GCN5 family acetyltransferase n=1 Tax=Pararhizobium antarcticum TaxID=1798805 RepID=A0A657LSX7_9HYPH|nr:GNAT family N-acetyltransferase [Pararhizobium antarcticum]OJF96810.1 GCN5 family acetyltransferase [Pararhizobium antarcticum]OJF98984.1 GCN5 family acetyltransferase [Rhizobium sp. 58]
MLEDGYHDIPSDKIVAVVTSLQMLQRPPVRAEASGPWTLRQHANIALDSYRDLYTEIGAEWLWCSRLMMSDEELASHVHSPEVEVHLLEVDGVAQGIAELDFRQAGMCEMAFFGISATQIGTGAGRWLMNRAIDLAWRHPIERFWLHTCTLDSPQALPFYMRSGFSPFKRQVEVFDDPRLSGRSPTDAAPHLPILTI